MGKSQTSLHTNYNIECRGTVVNIATGYVIRMGELVEGS
jgi:hypothetical protein